MGGLSGLRRYMQEHVWRDQALRRQALSLTDILLARIPQGTPITHAVFDERDVELMVRRLGGLVEASLTGNFRAADELCRRPGDPNVSPIPLAASHYIARMRDPYRDERRREDRERPAAARQQQQQQRQQQQQHSGQRRDDWRQPSQDERSRSPSPNPTTRPPLAPAASSSAQRSPPTGASSSAGNNERRTQGGARGQ